MTALDDLLRSLGQVWFAPAALRHRRATTPMLLLLVTAILAELTSLVRLMYLAEHKSTIVLVRARDAIWHNLSTDLVVVMVMGAIVVGTAQWWRRRQGRLTAFDTAELRTAWTMTLWWLVAVAWLKAVGGIVAVVAPAGQWLFPHVAINDPRFVVSGGALSWPRWLTRIAVAYGPVVVLAWRSLKTRAFELSDAPAASQASTAMRERSVGVVLLATVVLMAFGSVGRVLEHLESIKPVGIGEPVPDVPLPTLTRTGRGPRVSPLVPGKVVVLDFWASWCAPCRRSMPELSELVPSLGSDVKVLAINREPHDVAQAQKAFFAMDLAFDALIDDKGLGDKLGLTSLPTTFIVRPDGTLSEALLGYHKASAIKDAIDRARTTGAATP